MQTKSYSEWQQCQVGSSCAGKGEENMEGGFGAGSITGEAVWFANHSCQIGVYDGCDINYYL